MKSYVVDCAVRFFAYGAYYHLWFMPALFVAVCFVTIAAKRDWMKQLYFLSLILYVLGVMGCAYYQIGIEIPALDVLYQSEHFETIRRIFLMGVPFFAAGYIVPYVSERVKKSGLLLVGLAVLNICEIYFVSGNQLSSSVVLTFVLYPLTIMLLVFCLQHPMEHLKSTRLQRNVSSFVYFSHPLFLLLFYHRMGISETPAFLLTCLTSTVVGFFVSRTGGRHLSKIM